MTGKNNEKKMSLYKWIWQSYLRTALIPLVLVELVFIAIYFFTNNWSQNEMIGYLKNQVQLEMLQIADKEANVIEQQVLGVAHSADLYRLQTERAMKEATLFDAADESRMAYSPKGTYYTTKDRTEGGAAVFYSGIVPIGEKERAKVAKVLKTQFLMKDFINSEPLAASIYFNTFDSLNVIYPYFDVISQYAPLMDIPSYNFYYEADLAHNPDKTVKWTDVYLDPAGHGWMASAIAPVYNQDFLEGVVGIDVTVSNIISRILEMEIPFQGYSIVIGKDGNILALPDKGEEDFGLNELTDHTYDEAILKDTFKPEQFNIFKREDLGTFSTEVKNNESGFSRVMLKNKSQVVSWATIKETGWKLLVIVPEKNVYAEVEGMSAKLFQIGSFMIAGLIIFYSLFFFVLSRRARRMSLDISQPLIEVNGMVKNIGEGHYDQVAPDFNVEEFNETTSFIVKMGYQLGRAYDDLISTQDVLKKREADLQALVDSIDDDIIEIDEQGNILKIWSKNQNYLMEKLEDETNHSLEKFFDEKTAKMYIEGIRQAVETGESRSVEYQMGHKNDLRWYQAHISLIDQKTRTLVISARDITDRILMEESIIAAKDEAEKANNAKSQFLSNMSHELRTPLNAVLGFAQVLEMDPESPLTELQAQSVNEIIMAGNHLLILINEVLDLAKIESGKLTLSIEPVQIKSMMEETIGMIMPLADKHGIAIKTVPSACENKHVMADRTRIKQVLLNIISNAIKYNRKNGKVTLHCESNEDQMCFHIEDTGHGISEEDLLSIFKPFFRINDVDNTVEGTGIGLTVANQLIELMNGSIHVSSKVNEGSKFTVCLPLAQYDGDAVGFDLQAPIAQNEDHDPQNYKILYIEDNPANQRLVERILGGIPNIELIMDSNGERCVELALAHQPNLIILDINLPGMDGYEVFYHVKGEDALEHIPVIALSANAMPRDIEKTLNMGFVEYITKPIDARGFLKKIFDLLDRGE